MTKSSSHQSTLINALLDAQLYEHPVEKIELIETHISWVILTGPYAYKIKKPLNLGFLDFSTLNKRKQCCEEELRLNRRTAPDIYLEVITINGSPEDPRLATDGEIIDYAVKMNQFPQQSQLDRVLKRNNLTTAIIDDFAQMIADFHQQAAVADVTTEYGNSEYVLDPIYENFTQIREHIDDETCHKIIDDIEKWLKNKYQSFLPLLEERKKSGFIRECHGDLHLRNLAWINTKPVAFDCIEFNPRLRWIDVISDIAFLVMDLHARKHLNLAQHFLNAYLEITGDYMGIKLLPFYTIYRALVRAKVDSISISQNKAANIDSKYRESEFYTYLNLAKSYMQKPPVKLIINHGVSASGKSTFSQNLLHFMPVIRIRSDLERKRMANLKLSANAQAASEKNIYAVEFSEKVYDELALLSETIIDSGYSVIVDATFLDKSKREQFKTLASTKKVDFVILSYDIPEDILRKRISKRTHDASTADISVLDRMLLNFKPLDENEKTYSYTINTDTTAESIASLINN